MTVEQVIRRYCQEKGLPDGEARYANDIVDEIVDLSKCDIGVALDALESTERTDAQNIVYNILLNLRDLFQKRTI